MKKNRDGTPKPLTDAERAKRYRARLRGEDVPRGRPGRPPLPRAARVERAVGVLNYELGFMRPEDVDGLLGVVLDGVAGQIARLRQR